MKKLTLLSDNEEAESITYSKSTSFLLSRVEDLELMSKRLFDVRIQEEKSQLQKIWLDHDVIIQT